MASVALKYCLLSAGFRSAESAKYDVGSKYRTAGWRVLRVLRVRAWKKASPTVMRHLLAFVQCVNVMADIPLCEKLFLHVLSELRSKLAAALARGEKQKSFAKEFGFSEKPLTKYPEAMIHAYPDLEGIDYSASVVEPGINASL